MTTVVALLEYFAQRLAALSWQITLLILLVLAATWLLRRAQPTTRYVLWSVVLLRLCLPWSFQSPLGVRPLSRISATEPEHRRAAESEVLPARMNAAVSLFVKEQRDTAAGKPVGRGTETLARKATIPFHRRFTPWAWIGILWLAGATALSVAVLRRWSGLRKIARQSTVCIRPELQSLLEQLRHRFGLRREIALLRLPAGTDALGACASGWRRPQILLPARLLDSWEPSALEPILIHELAHIRRGDLLINAVQVFTQIVYWFHPLVWFAHSHLRRERELICDDFAVLHSGATARRYGATIVRALQEIGATPGWSLAGVGMGESGLVTRLRRLLDGRYALPRPLGRCGLTALLLGGVLSVLIASDPSREKSRGSASRDQENLAHLVAAQKAAAPEPFDERITPPSPALLKFLERAHRQAADPEDPRALPVAVGPKGELSGQVVDRFGKPVAEVLVDAWDWHPGNETRTGADGNFQLTTLNPDERVEVRFIKDGFAPYTIIKQPLGALIAPVVLDEQTYFEGLLTAPDGSPVANALLRANQGPKQADGVQISTIWTETRSDAQGRYRLRVQDDTYDLQVTSPAGLVARRKVTIAPRQVVPLNLQLAPGVVFRARIVDVRTGDPIPDVRLHHWQHPGTQGTSNRQGDLQIAGLIPGRFEFNIDAKGYARWWSEECSEAYDRRKIEDDGWQRNFDHLHFDLTPGMEPVTIILEKVVRIRGRIVDPNGQSVAGATASAALTGTGNSLTGDTRFSVKTRDDGTFEMHLPASNAREYNLVAHDGGYREWRNWANGVSEPMRTWPGEEIQDLELKLSRAATVRGQVVDAKSAPVAERDVRASAADKRDNRYYDPASRTDQDGRFEIKFIRPGKHYIQVAPFWLQSERAPSESSQLVELAEGETVELPGLLPPQPR